MVSLSFNWFAEGTLDFEYKQYLLLAYLDGVKKCFAEAKLYPPLAEVIGHYRNLQQYKERKQAFVDDLPQTLTGVDLQRLLLNYTPSLPPDETLQVIDEIVDFSLPRLQHQADEGRRLYDLVERKLNLLPVGLLPLYKNEGYLLLRLSVSNDIWVYQFCITRIQSQVPGDTEKMHGIHTRFVTTYSYGLANTYENMKMDLVRNRAELPNPATYAIESALAVPVEETLLPIAKRKLLRAVNA
jgi:hypothetical protein